MIEEYKPQQESLKFFNWNNLVFGNDTHETPKNHFRLIDELTTSHRKFVGCCHRGFAKSTLMSHKFPLYVATIGRFPNFGYVKNSLLLSSSYDQAAQQLKTCASLYTGSDKLQSFLDLEKQKEGELIFNNMKGKRFRIASFGSGQALRGTNWEGQRPEWIIADDIQEDGILQNPKLAEDLKSWWVSTVMQAIDISHYKITAIGTPMIETDLINSMMQSPEYNKVKFPVANEFSTNPSKMISGWADRFTPESIIAQYNDAKALGKESDFFREMFLEMANEETQIFKKDWFKKFSKKELMKDRQKYNFFTSLDIAVSKKESADRSVIMTVAVNGEGHIFVVDIVAGRLNPSEVIEALFKQVRTYRPIEVRAEKAALQQVLNHFIDQKMLKENTHFLLSPLVYNSTTKKEVRILGLQPKLKARMIHFPDDVCQDEVLLLEKELLGQTRETNTTGHDDCHPYYTLVDTCDGQKRICDLKIGDNVISYLSNDAVVSYIKNVIISGEKDIFEITLDNGDVVECSENHPLLTESGWCLAKNLSDNYLVRNSKWKKHIMESDSLRIVDITYLQQLLTEEDCGYININGNVKISPKYQKAIAFIILTTIKIITTSKILHASASNSIILSILKSCLLGQSLVQIYQILQKLDHLLLLQKEENILETISKELLELLMEYSEPVICAEENSNLILGLDLMLQNFALSNVSKNIERKEIEKIQSIQNVLSAIQFSEEVETLELMQRQHTVVNLAGKSKLDNELELVKVVSVKKKEKVLMYNLEVEITNNFSVSGYISHNCADTLANFLDDGFIFGGSDYAEVDDSTFRFEVKDPCIF